ncbi:MAG: hypothetical protein ACPL5I_06325 [Thermodesulfobacteriota bacterium]
MGIFNELLTPALSLTGLCPDPFSVMASNPHLLRGSVATSLISRHYEIATVATLPRDDITTRFEQGEGEGEEKI